MLRKKLHDFHSLKFFLVEVGMRLNEKLNYQ